MYFVLAHDILAFIAYAQKPSLNAHRGVFSGARAQGMRVWGGGGGGGYSDIFIHMLCRLGSFLGVRAIFGGSNFCISIFFFQKNDFSGG